MAVGVAELKSEIPVYRLFAEMGEGELGFWLRVNEGIDELPAHRLK